MRARLAHLLRWLAYQVDPHHPTSDVMGWGGPETTTSGTSNVKITWHS